MRTVHSTLAKPGWRSKYPLPAMCAALGWCLSMSPTQAQTIAADIQSRVHTFTLKNGMQFIVLERHEAPVVSCFTQADVGAARGRKGITGLAHLFEHMAFKGSHRIGGTN